MSKKHTLTKISHTEHSLDGKVLETRSYLPHDLMHFSYAAVTRSEEGFFKDGTNMMREEVIVGMLQGAYKEYLLRGEAFDITAWIIRANEYLQVQSHEPLTLSPELILSVFEEYTYLYNRWQKLRTGESIVVDLT